MKKSRFYVYLIIAALVFFVGGFAVKTLAVSHEATTGTSGDKCIRESGKYQFINPLLLCESPELAGLSQYTVLKNNVQSFINKITAGVPNEEVSVYFSNLNGVSWFGINENAQFSPASLLKVPVMISYLKLSEEDPSILSKVLVYDGSFDDNAAETFKSPYDIKPGAYKVSDLITAMIVNSDNNALTLLTNNISSADLDEVFTDLGVPVVNNSIDYLTAKSYSQFFRILYNGTYLSQDDSEKALELLAGPDFPQGIKAGVSSSTVVAQKFGERSVLDTAGNIQWQELHNCGIIYYPNKPYLLCIMTKGPDFAHLLPIIQGISKLVYNQIVADNATSTTAVTSATTTAP